MFIKNVFNNIISHITGTYKVRFEVYSHLLKEHENKIHILHSKVFDIVHFDINELFKRVMVLENNNCYINLLSDANKLSKEIEELKNNIYYLELYNDTLLYEINELKEVIDIKDKIIKKRFK